MPVATCTTCRRRRAAAAHSHARSNTTSAPLNPKEPWPCGPLRLAPSLIPQGRGRKPCVPSSNRRRPSPTHLRASSVARAKAAAPRLAPSPTFQPGCAPPPLYRATSCDIVRTYYDMVADEPRFAPPRSPLDQDDQPACRAGPTHAGARDDDGPTPMTLTLTLT